LQTGAADNTIAGNFIGVDPTGTTARGGSSDAITLAGDNNTVGGPAPADRNVIADYSWGMTVIFGSSNEIQNNYIGTDATGTAALRNTIGIRMTSDNNIIGGSNPGEGNLIVGGSAGIEIDLSTAFSNDIRNNQIGTDVNGNLFPALTGSSGIVVRGGASNIDIGGFGAADSNLIAGHVNGIVVEDAQGVSIRNNVIRDNTVTGVVVSDPMANRIAIQDNAIYDNGALGIDLGDDGVSPNDFFDADSGPNGLQNAPVMQRAVLSGTVTLFQGFINTTPNTDVEIALYSTAACDSSNYGEGETLLENVDIFTNSSGYATFQTEFNAVVPNGTAITALASTGDGELGFTTSEFSRCIIVGPNNDTWPNAFPIALTPSGLDAMSGSAEQYLTAPGQTRWFRFPVAPDSTVIVDLSSLPANYDLTLFRDIAQTYNELNQPQSLEDLAQLSAEFAPDMFTPDMFTPEMFTPEMFTPDMFTPDMFTPDMFTPDMFTPDMFTPDMFTPDMFTPDMFTPDMFTPDMFTPDMFTPDMFTPDMFTPDMFTPDMFTPDQRYYASALAQSAVAVSAFDGSASETAIANSWSEGGEFYVSVTGRNGAFDLTDSFDLDVTVLGAECNGLTIFDAEPDISGIGSNAFDTLILVDSNRMVDYAATSAKLSQLANHPAVNGAIVDVSTYPAIVDANGQADTLYQCVYAKNVVAYGIKDIVDAYRANNPDLKYIVAVGNDDIIPFFRYPDQALLANESGYVPPVLDTTASQAQLQNGYVLGQDTYGVSVEVDRRNTSIPVPELAVGRLVETAGEINAAIDAFLATNGTIPAPDEALVTGYDFLADAANAIEADLLSGLGPNGSVTTLVDQETVAPVNGWNAEDLRTVLLDESADYDLVYLAGHFSSFSTLAADNQSRVLASELLNPAVDFTNAIVFSNGCHSGYNLVSDHAVPGVTVEPDWAQVFAGKGAILIAGTGYQYGDTEFVEYGERLYFEFTRELRRGSGPVSVGDALVRAKQVYLSETAEMRPIHEKTLLISTLFGLPMTTIDMPGDRYNPVDDTILVAPIPVTINPGTQLNLETFDLTVTPTISRQVETLENVVDETLVETVYYYPSDEPDSLVINPGELILPLDLLRLQAADTVLRGIGFRGGSYTDVLDQIPFTGAATTELRGIHAPFISNVFYPVLPWDVNYFDVLSGSVATGTVNLGVIRVQYRSNAADSLDGTMRVYDDLNFRLFFSDETGAYTNATEGVTNIPALAGAPTIALVLATSDNGSVDFEVTVTGDPSAGMQTVWVTYTSTDAPLAGEWASLDLTQDSNDSRIWRGTLDLQGSSAENLRYLVQAANGVGLVSIDTNRGAYHAPDVDPANPGTPPGTTSSPAPVVLEFTGTPPTSGVYGTSATFSVRLTSSGTPLSGQTIEFGLTSQRQRAVTDANGVATVALTVIGEPVNDIVRATYAGTPGYAAASAESPFTIEAIATQLTLLTTQPTFSAGGGADLSIALSDNTGRPQPWRWVLVVVRDGFGDVAFAESVQTDLFGNANLLTTPLTAGNYTVEAYFATVVTLPGIGTIDMRLPRFEPTVTPDVGDPPIAFITNTPPSADAGGSYAVFEGDSVILDAGASSDVNTGQDLNFAWDLNNSGSFESTGITVTYFATLDDGPILKTVAVEVCDPTGDCDVATATIDVQNVAPTIEAIVHDAAVNAGEPFTVTVQATDPVDMLSYSYDCDGDLSYEIGPTPDNEAACTITTAGSATINVLVDDGDATTGGSSTIEVVATDPPSVTIIPSATVFEGQTVAFDADFLTNGNPSPFIISWDFGDGNTASGSLQPEHLYNMPGVYDVTLTVTSVINGSSATDTQQIVVLYGFMQACAYVADSGAGLTIDKDSSISCLLWSEGKATIKKDTFVAGSVYALGDDVKVEDSAEILGDIITAGKVTVEKDAIVNGNIIAGDDVEIKEGAYVAGDITASGAVEVKNGATVDGTVTEYAAQPILPVTSSLNLALSAGGPQVDVKKNEVESLAPGSFGKLHVHKDSTLNLSSGHYQFDEWQVDKDVTIVFDVTNGPIIVDVVGKIEFDKHVVMSVVGGGADQLLFRSTGDKLQVDKDNLLIGTYLVLSADATLKKNTQLDGAIFAHALKVEDGVQITDARALPIISALMIDGTLSGP
ncbi:MAG: PKD domain-containing protein, partial [Anaerolineae bacterium]|nr:PKD domain-containing protein [Anaerolineae bacterium]